MDIKQIKNDFPILARQVNGKPLVYLDNAATSQKPKVVVEAISDYYLNHNANIHRGIHTLGDESTRIYADSRKIIANFIGTSNADELIFVRNTTEAINLVMNSWGRNNIGEGDVIIATEMEHHSNIVPWQVLAKEKGAKLIFVKVDENGELDLEDYEEKLKLNPKLVTVVQVSNFLGTINPVTKMIEMAHRQGAKVLVDGAQSTPHMRVNVTAMNVDFFAFSGHKMMGPMGIGGLYVKKSLFETMKPNLYGGGMIDEVMWAESTYADLPDRYDAGTPNVVGAVGLAAAVEYLEKLGMDQILKHEQELMSYASGRLSEVKGIRIFGPEDVNKRSGVVAFTMEKIHAHDVAQLLDRQMGVAVRSGHHCVMPLHVKYGIPATTRASYYIYNNESDVDILMEGLNQVRKILG